MAIARTTILSGPAIVQMGAATFYTKDDIKVVTHFEQIEVNTAAYGAVGTRVKDIKTEITFTPTEWESAGLGVLYPHTNPVAGTSMFTGTDVPVTIHPMNGLEKMVYNAGAVTKMPDLNFSAINPNPFGACTITCISSNNIAWATANSRYTLTGTSAFSDTSFLVTNMKTVVYTVAVGTTPWDAVKTKDGVRVSFSLETTPVETDDDGLVDLLVKGVKVSVKFAPVGLTLAQVLTKLNVQGSGVVRGMEGSTGAVDLTITGAGTGSPLVTIENAVLVGAGQTYGYGNLRHDEIEFIATRPTGSGALFSVSSVPA
jgi:hypothetical protein